VESEVKAIVRQVDDHGHIYQAILVWCPGCESTAEDGHKQGGLHMLPVSGDSADRPIWTWNNDLELVTLDPSILTKHGGDEFPEFVCHSFLRNGVWEFLGDCTHSLAGQHVPMVPLPDWVTDAD
jgi:hypothetical protein